MLGALDSLQYGLGFFVSVITDTNPKDVAKKLKFEANNPVCTRYRPGTFPTGTSSAPWTFQDLVGLGKHLGWKIDGWKKLINFLIHYSHREHARGVQHMRNTSSTTQPTTEPPLLLSPTSLFVSTLKQTSMRSWSSVKCTDKARGILATALPINTTQQASMHRQGTGHKPLVIPYYRFEPVVPDDVLVQSLPVKLFREAMQKRREEKEGERKGGREGEERGRKEQEGKEGKQQPTVFLHTPHALSPAMLRYQEQQQQRQGSSFLRQTPSRLTTSSTSSSGRTLPFQPSRNSPPKPSPSKPSPSKPSPSSQPRVVFRSSSFPPHVIVNSLSVPQLMEEEEKKKKEEEEGSTRYKRPHSSLNQEEEEEASSASTDILRLGRKNSLTSARKKQRGVKLHVPSFVHTQEKDTQGGGRREDINETKHGEEPNGLNGSVRLNQLPKFSPPRQSRQPPKPSPGSPPVASKSQAKNHWTTNSLTEAILTVLSRAENGLGREAVILQVDPREREELQRILNHLLESFLLFEAENKLYVL